MKNKIQIKLEYGKHTYIYRKVIIVCLSALSSWIVTFTAVVTFIMHAYKCVNKVLPRKSILIKFS